MKRSFLLVNTSTKPIKPKKAFQIKARILLGLTLILHHVTNTIIVCETSFKGTGDV